MDRLKWNNFKDFISNIISNPLFETASLIIININAILMASADYSKVDSNGNLVSQGSLINTAIQNSDIVFTTIFTIEFIMKFTVKELEYFSDYWNNFDLFVIFISWLSLGQNIPGIKVFRLLRLLRPLRSINSYPELAAMVKSTFNALVKLQSFLIIFIFFLFFFGILGLQLFSGPYLHSRCRLTPFPVNSSWNPGDDFNLYRCSSAPNFNLPEEFPSWTKESSPWFEPKRDCLWPVDQSDTNLCSLGSEGSHQCYHDLSSIPQEQWRWCGSDFDGLGNYRFSPHIFSEEATYAGSFGWGYINFDNLGISIMIVLQTLTMTGWSTPILYLTQNSTNSYIPAIYFVAVVILGPLFMLQLIIALVQDSFQSEIELIYQLKMKVEEEHMKSLKPVKVYPIEGEGGEGTGLEEKLRNDSRVLKPINKNESQNPEAGCVEAGIIESTGPAQSKIEEKSPPFILRIMTGCFNYISNRIIGFEAWLIGLEGPVGDSIRFVHFKSSTLCNSKSYDWILSGLVILNTIVLSMDHYPMQLLFGQVLDLLNFFLTISFAVDMLIKILGQGLNSYCSSAVNFFDAFVVVAAIVELILTPAPDLLTGSHSLSSSGSISSLRSFRLIRILRLFKSKQFRAILLKCFKSIVSLGNFGILLVLYTFIMTLFGMQVFANRFRFDAEGKPILDIGSINWQNAADWPRHNYDDFTHSFATVFQTITGDNWNNLLYNSLRLGNGTFLFCIFNVATGNFIIANLITAMIVNNFTSTPHDDLPVDSLIDPESQRFTSSKLLSIPRSFFEQCSNILPTVGWFKSNVKISPTEYSPVDGNEKDSNLSLNEAELGQRIPKEIADLKGSDHAINYMLKDFRIRLIQVLESPYFESLILSLIFVSSVSLALDNPLLDPNTSLSKFLVGFNTAVTIIFTLEMAFKLVAYGIYGYLFKENSQIEAWNWLDMFVVMVSLIGLDQSPHTKNVKSLRALRSLRPLRFISRFPGLSAIVNALISAIPAILEVIGIFFVIYFIFAIFIVGYFKGQLRGCSISTFPTISYLDDNTIPPLQTNPILSLITYPKSWGEMSMFEREWFGPADVYNSTSLSYAGFNCTGLWPTHSCCPSLNTLTESNTMPTSRVLCECLGGQWVAVANKLFDNVAQGLMSLVMLGSLDNWSCVMWAFVDATGIDMQPIRNNSVTWAYVTILFVIFGNFLCMNFFVAVVCEKFEELNREEEDIFLSEEQREWIKTKKFLLTMKPKTRFFPPDNPFRLFIFKVVDNPIFEKVMLTAIFTQGILMASNHFGEPTAATKTISILVDLTGWVFVCESILKLIAYMPKHYFQESWNQFDFVIAVISLISSIGGIINIYPHSVSSTLRIFRLIRLVKMIKLATLVPKLNEQAKILILASPSIMNILTLLFLILFIFAVMGQNLFAKVEYFNSLNASNNFRTFGSSMLLLIRFSTGEGWSDFTYDVSHQQQGCVADPPFNSSYCGFHDSPDCIPLNGCGSNAIFPFLIVFSWTVSVIFLNVFVAVMITNFQQIQGGGQTVQIRYQDYEKFVDIWSEFDGDGERRIRVEDIPTFMTRLFDPFGYGGNKFSMRQLNRRVGKLVIYKSRFPDSVGDVLFNDVLLVLTASAYERALKIFGLKDKTNHISVDHKTPQTIQILSSSEYTPLTLASSKNGYVTYNEFYHTQIIQLNWKKRTQRLKGGGVKTKKAPTEMSN